MSNNNEQSKFREVCILPNGYALFVREDEVGGREYISDEVPCGVAVWQTSLVDESTILACLAEEHRLRIAEYYSKKAPQ